MQLRQRARKNLPFGRALALVLVLAMVGTTAYAAIFTVTLSNGTSFETRYRPVQSEWDENMVMIMTDKGNWIALAKSEVVGVESQAEAKGYGYQLNTSTFFLGWTPNDAGPDEEVDANGEVKANSDAGADEEWSYDYGDEGGGSDFSLDQFLDIPIDGGPIGGGIGLDAEVDG